MQQIATVSSNGAPVTYDNGVFAVAGEVVGIEKIMEYDKLGVLNWASDETRVWAQQIAASAPAAPSAPVAATTPAPVKKPWYTKWWVWVIVVFVLLAAIGSCSGGGKEETKTPSEPAATAPAPAEQPAQQPAAQAPAPAEQPAEQTVKLGQPLKVGDLVFTANSAKTTQKLKSPLGDKKGNWIDVTVTVKNESKEAVTIDSSFFKLLSADGAEYETDSDSLMYIDSDKSLFLEKINPGLSKEGQVLFAVPAGAQPAAFKLQVQTGFFGTQTGEIALTK